MNTTNNTAWFVFTGDPNNNPSLKDDNTDDACQPSWIPPGAPPWRTFKGQPPKTARKVPLAEDRPPFQFDPNDLQTINAAIFLRRPLLITGNPGTGKSSMAYAIARELALGCVLKWPINTRSRLEDGLYSYDAIARLQDHALEKENGKKAPPDIGEYIQLGPLGTAFLPSNTPRVLLIDEIDKSDIDFPNDLLHIFEDGGFAIPELMRLAKDPNHKEIEVRPWDPVDSESKVEVVEGRVLCHAFPIVIMTSNGERDFPAPFLRRCIRLKISDPEKNRLFDIVKAHFGQDAEKKRSTIDDLIDQFLNKRGNEKIATDQFLNTVFFVLKTQATLNEDAPSEQEAKQSLWKTLTKELR